eukprot:361477-Chlamydomonas_euryale.AAC.3
MPEHLGDDASADAVDRIDEVAAEHDEVVRGHRKRLSLVRAAVVVAVTGRRRRRRCPAARLPDV